MAERGIGEFRVASPGFEGEPDRPEVGGNHSRTYDCPECPERFTFPESLAKHLERHRPVETLSSHGSPKARVLVCPRGCGRRFEVGTAEGRVSRAEFRGHVRLCEGEPPLCGATDAYGSILGGIMAKLRCEECGKIMGSPQALGGHAKVHRAGKRKTAESDGPGLPLESTVLQKVARNAQRVEEIPFKNGAIRKALMELEERRERLEREILETRTAIDAVNKILAAEDGRPT